MKLSDARRVKIGEQIDFWMIQMALIALLMSLTQLLIFQDWKIALVYLPSFSLGLFPGILLVRSLICGKQKFRWSIKAPDTGASQLFFSLPLLMTLFAFGGVIFTLLSPGDPCSPNALNDFFWPIAAIVSNIVMFVSTRFISIPIYNHFEGPDAEAME